ncbi:hypothetical protein SAMN04487969_101224 [Paenibacillus algorifonticola]|uniref:Uncharacterized protein n=1 Tax=Paenibacillus algorifonticola TaxID=684063 RepID=A0A1I1Y5T9_9BACL|nr:hypothetical protein [Paenibacillus algorifonticola]SFE13200.1 hypothetical protein SAMN04487969_101224 [Paenibacillus algorifonticola]
MTNDREYSAAQRAELRISRILNPNHPLSREDVIWMLEYIKKKVADDDPALTGLSQPRLLRNFHCFAEAAMSLIHRGRASDQEADRLQGWLKEASYGLTAAKRSEPHE